MKKAGNHLISCSVVPPVSGWYSVLKFGGRLAREIIFCHSVQLHGKWKVVLEF